MNCENRVVRQYRGNDADRTAVRTTTKKAVRNARSVCSTAVSCSTAGPQSAVSKTAHFGAYRTTSFTRGRKWYDHLIRPSLTRNSAHEIDLIRQAQQLASKPSQLIPAERWPLGFNAGLVEHAAELMRTKTAGRGMAHQRTRQALCRLVITAIADTLQTHESALRGNAAFKGLSCNRPHDGKSREGLHARAILLVPTLEVRKTRARTARRFGRSTVGETYEPRAMLGIEGQNTGSGVVVGAELDRSRISRHPSPI